MRAKSRKITPKKLKEVVAAIAIVRQGFLGAELPDHLKPAAENALFICSVFDGLEPEKDSSNSGKSPGGDIGRPKKTREKGARKQGGQKGHKGHTHELSPNPDVIIVVSPEIDENDPNWQKVAEERRQVIDIESRSIVTEYQSSTFTNIETGEKVSGSFPEGVNAPVQTGPELKALIIYLREENHLSYERIAEHLKNLYNIDLSEATLKNIINKAEKSDVLANFEEAARESFIKSESSNADESAISVDGKNCWVHILVNTVFTLLCLHPKRGKEAMEAIGIIPKMKGFLIHDSYASYFLFKNVLHALCNAHILRELQAATDVFQKWSQDMSEFLQDLNILVNCHDGKLPLDLQKWARDVFREILDEGYEETGGRVLAKPPGEKKRRGRIAKPKYRNLLERLDLREDEVLRFITDALIPFTNNDAERPVRMLKVQMKISGCFRSFEMAQGHCKMRGYLVSCKKNGIGVYDAIKMVVKGETPQFIREWLK